MAAGQSHTTRIGEVEWLNRGVYSVADVAELIGASYGTVSRWVFRGLAEDALSVDFHGRYRTILGFYDLITLRVVQRLREEGHSLQRIRKHHDDWVRVYDITHPFATNRVFSDHRDIYLKDEGEPMSSSRLGQQVWLDVIRDGLRDVTFDESTALASSWQPVEFVTIDPLVQYGTPCVTGTRVPVATVAQMRASGESIAITASAYGISDEAVLQVVEWHGGTTSAA